MKKYILYIVAVCTFLSVCTTSVYAISAGEIRTLRTEKTKVLKTITSKDIRTSMADILGQREKTLASIMTYKWYGDTPDRQDRSTYQAETYTDIQNMLKTISSTMPVRPADTDITRIEANVVTFQKSFLAPIVTRIAQMSISDLLQTGNMHADISGKDLDLHVGLSNIKSISSLRTNASSMSATLYISGSIENNTGSISIDAEYSMYGTGMYLLVRSYTANISDASTQKEIRTAMDKIVGTTWEIDGSRFSIDTVSQANTLKQILDILQTQSLFTPTSTYGSAYLLSLKESTFQSIAKILDNDISAKDMKRMQKEFRFMLPIYTDSTITFEAITPSSVVSLDIAHTNGIYKGMNFVGTDRGMVIADRTIMNMSATTTGMDMSSTMNGYSTAISFKNNIGTFSVKNATQTLWSGTMTTNGYLPTSWDITYIEELPRGTYSMVSTARFFGDLAETFGTYPLVKPLGTKKISTLDM